MYLVVIGWLYVVLMMAVAEALSTQGSVLGAVITFLFYGMLPVVLIIYIGGTPHRRRARQAAEAAAASASASASAAAAAAPPHGSGHAAGDAVAAERKEA
jgi:hypothetical protein